MNWLFWQYIAWVVTGEKVRDWLITRAMRTPYTHITAPDDPNDVYMYRYWLFNPYPDFSSGQGLSWWRRLLPSIRIHRIMRADSDRHLHDHPWNARTIILHGWYEEQRYGPGFTSALLRKYLLEDRRNFERHTLTERSYFAGDTAKIKFNEFHRISAVPSHGVFTMFITWRYRGVWGFDVRGHKVPWREYLNQKQATE